MFFHTDEEQLIEKAQKDLNELDIKLVNEKRIFENDMAAANIDIEATKERLSQPINFKPDEWLFIQNRSKELDDRQQQILDGTVDPRKPKQTQVQNHWLFCK